MDFNFPCPHCTQELLCSVEHAGLTLTCPVCNGDLTVPQPPTSLPQLAKEPVTYWAADVRVLVLRAPPAYTRMLIEVPQSWPLPVDAVLPPLALDAVRQALRGRYPQCPVTPLRVHWADSESVKLAERPTQFSNESCRAWSLGTAPVTV